MCKKLKEHHAGLIKRFIVWLAWHFLKPKCDACDEADACAYNTIMNKKRED